MSPLEIGPMRPVGAIDARVVRTAGGPNGHDESEKTLKAGSAAPAVVRSDALDPGQPPVDAERVSVIRKAIESGTYPLNPAKIADAVIAAGLLLRSAK